MNVGIMTYYYNSVNYGGVLQSYALCKAINKMGIECEQISFDYTTDIKIRNSDRQTNSNSKKISRKIKMCITKKYFKKRYKCFSDFRNSIPHSKIIYSANTIKRANDDYAIFVTGSDQVWNFEWFIPSFFLEFADKEKKKIAYAASLGMMQIDDSKKEYLSKELSTYDAISVRERDAVDLIKSCLSSEVKHVIDPTLLLDKEEWELVTAQRIINEKYVFCHFIGDDINYRKLAKSFAELKGYKLAVLPHPSRLNKNDFGFGDYQTKNAGPSEFISLIKYAEYIFTDSFHCCAFSTIFFKQFFAFHRKGKKGMASRIYSLMNTIDGMDHFCDEDSKITMSYINEISDIDYNKRKKLNNLQVKSIEFLQDCLKV